MHKKFVMNRTKIKGSCQSGRKVVTHNSKSDLPLAQLVKKELLFAGENCHLLKMIDDLKIFITAALTGAAGIATVTKLSQLETDSCGWLIIVDSISLTEQPRKKDYITFRVP